MCGIAGYIGKKCAEQELIQSLKLLEYRGYDSAGIAVFNKKEINITKCAGKICDLEKHITSNTFICGIAHTRWATHGKATNINAHPHLSNSNSWAIVHNGIIENYSILKKDLIQNGYVFNSETDTEVIANLLESNSSLNPINALIQTCNKFNGSYALACIHTKTPNTIYLARKKSPLYVATKNKCTYIASDPICFASKVDEYYSLDDDIFCIATAKKLEFYDNKSKKINLEPIKTSNINSYTDKQDYHYFMEKEIHETPQVLKNIVKIYKNNNIFSKFDENFIKKYNKVIFIGCGTAYHAGLMGTEYLRTYARIDAHCYIASEYRYSNPIVDKNTLCILVSQSGETADTLACCELIKKLGGTTIALTNVLYSSLAKNTDYILPVCAGCEIAVASTKAYIAQISVIYMFALHLQNLLQKKNNKIFKNIIFLSQKIAIPTKKTLNKAIVSIKKSKKVFFIGRNYDYVTICEAGLKLKEITYINTAEHAAGELKHGFLSLVDENSVVFVLATQKHVLDKTLNGANEALSRGAKIILFTQFDLPKEQTINFTIIKLQKFDEDIMPISCIIYFQMLAYLTSISKGLNPDQPRNLAKSVTVE